MNQWSLSEDKGVLRVASTEEPTWWNPGPQEESESFVTTLGEKSGALVQLGRVGGLGKGERVYAVRFAGDTGYVVTFRRVDPLYTLDLSTPSRPTVLGELKIRGYSAYLHPLGGDLLLGIGQDASDEGRVLGTQLSLFDVSNLRRPVLLRTHALGSSWSEAETDHHAFLWWGPSRLAVLPVQAYNEKPFIGAVGFRVGRGGIDEAGRVTHSGEASPGGGGRVAGAPIRRSLVVGDALYTVSEAGVKATDLASFADAGWAAFPPSTGSVPPSRLSDADLQEEYDFGHEGDLHRSSQRTPQRRRREVRGARADGCDLLQRLSHLRPDEPDRARNGRRRRSGCCRRPGPPPLVTRSLVARIHNPHNRGCGCDADCWCNRTGIGRTVKWWFPARWFGIQHKLTFVDGMTLDERAEWKRRQDSTS